MNCIISQLFSFPVPKDIHVLSSNVEITTFYNTESVRYRTEYIAFLVQRTNYPFKKKEVAYR